MSEVSSLPQRLPIPNFPGYAADISGTIWSCWKKGNHKQKKGDWHPLKPRPHVSRGGFVYQTVALYKNGAQVSRLVHQLILETFVGPRPKGMEVRHYPNNDKTDNRLANLSYGTKSQNQLDRVQHGTHCRGDKSNLSKVTERQRQKLITEYLQLKPAYKGRLANLGNRLARKYGLSPGHVERLARDSQRAEKQ